MQVTSTTCQSSDPRMREGYHPTLWEQVRLFLYNIWRPSKFKGMVRGMKYVNGEAKKNPKVGSPFLDGIVYTLDGIPKKISDFIKIGRPLVINTGSFS